MELEVGIDGSIGRASMVRLRHLASPRGVKLEAVGDSLGASPEMRLAKL